MLEKRPPKSDRQAGDERIHGRHRGLQIEWTRERFAEFVQRDVALKADHGWSFDHTWWWVRSVYELDERSTDMAKAAVEEVFRARRRRAGSARR